MRGRFWVKGKPSKSKEFKKNPNEVLPAQGGGPSRPPDPVSEPMDIYIYISYKRPIS